ncbi:MAG: hypothetical protein MJZ27_11175 [Bacteroidales bacterium]|nr:hypothetical protein [Bacteroidales bacterium]
MLQKLKRSFIFAILIPILIFILAFLAKNEPYTTDEQTATIMAIFFILVLALVPLTSYWLRHTTNKAADLPEEEGERMVSRAYTIRIWSLSAAATIAGILYFVTCENNSLYVFAMIIVLMAASYPSEKYIYNE